MRDFTAASAVERGADAGKLLVPYRADRPAPAKRQDTVIRAAAADCHRAGLPLVVEPLVRRLSTEIDRRVRGGLPAARRRGGPPGSGRSASIS